MRTRQVVRSGAWAGVVGALVMVLGQAIARLGAGVPMFPDLLEDAFTRAIPSVVFARVLDTLKFQAKPLLFVGILVLQILAGALIGVVFALIWGREIPGLRRHWSGWTRALLCAGLAWLVTNLVLLPVVGGGFFGAETAVGPVGLNVALVIGYFLYGITLAGTYRVSIIRAPVAGEEAEPSPERRRLLGGLAVGTVAILAAGATYRIMTDARRGVTVTVASSTDSGTSGSLPQATVAPPTNPPTSAGATATIPTDSAASRVTTVSAPTPTTAASGGAAEDTSWNVTGELSEVTPTDKFYVVSKNFFSDPVVDANQWALEIGGLVKKPYKIDFAQLQKLPHEDRYQTLECISNEIGGDLIGTARWRGVSLRNLIAAAEPDPKAVKVKFSAADGYTDDLPVERAMSPANLLAYSMNGEPLGAPHGAPARLLIPGIYGMKNVKWLTRVELVADDYKGYWEQRGWSDEATILTMSQTNSIDTQHPTIPPGTVELAGVAFAGDRGISRVEVSVDGGETWQNATLKDPLGPYTWRLWRWRWDAKPGQYTVVVRATDGTGKVQTSEETDTLPNGATGWDTRPVRVS